MRKSLIILGLSSCYFFGGCREVCKEKPLHTDTKEKLFFYKTNSYWVMRDSATNVLDTLICSSTMFEGVEVKDCHTEQKWISIFEFKNNTLSKKQYCMTVRTKLGDSEEYSFNNYYGSIPFETKKISLQNKNYHTFKLNQDIDWAKGIGFVRILLSDKVLLLEDYEKDFSDKFLLFI